MSKWIKLLFKMGTNENPAELCFISRCPSLLMWTDRLYSAGPPRSHLRPRASTLNRENTNNSKIGVRLLMDLFLSWPSISILSNHLVSAVFWALDVWYAAFSDLPCKLLWLEKILVPQIPDMPLGCFSIKTVRPRFMLLTLPLLLSHVGESQKTMLY